MWNTTRRIMLMALLVVGGLLGAAPRNAAAVPGTGFVTSFQIQNLGSAPANCTYDIYSNAGGAAAYQQAIASAIPVGGSVLVFTGDPANGGTGIPAGVNSGVVSCDQEVAAVVVYQNATKRDAYVATKNPANIMYAPAVYNNFYNFNTEMRIQNASASQQAVKVEYFAPGSASPLVTSNYTLEANGSVTVDQSTLPQLLTNVSYSAKVTGAAPLAVNVSIYGRTGTNVEPHLYAYSGFSGGATKVYTPVVLKNFYGYNSSTTIQNIGSQEATVKRTFSNGLVENFTIPANSSVARADFQNAGLAAGNTQYSSTIESTNGQQLIVIVNQSVLTKVVNGVTIPINRATTYEGLTEANGSTIVVAPSTVKRFYGYNSSISCQNVGTVATDVSVAYIGKAGNANVNLPAAVVKTALAPGAVHLIYQPDNASLPAGFNGSATITSSGNQKLVCVVNQDQNEAPAFNENKDVFASYNGIAKQP